MPELRRQGKRGLDRENLDTLCAYLEPLVISDGCDNTLRFSQEWCLQNDLDWAYAKKTLQDAGGYCDCEVLINVDPKRLF